MLTMTPYRIHAPLFTADLSVSGDFCELRDFIKAKGWTLVPMIESAQPQWLEFGNRSYELHWREGTITRVTLHRNGESVDIAFRDLPEQVRNLL